MAGWASSTRCSAPPRCTPRCASSPSPGRRPTRADARPAGAAGLREPDRAAGDRPAPRARRALDLYVLIGASAAMFSLVLLRMAGIVRRHEEVTGARGGAADRAGRTSRHRRSEERLSSLIKNSSDVVCIARRATRSCTTSAPRSSDVRLRPRALAGRELIEIVHPDDAPRAALADRRDRRAARRSALAREFRVRHGRGEALARRRGAGTNLLATRRSRGSC